MGKRPGGLCSSPSSPHLPWGAPWGLVRVPFPRELSPPSQLCLLAPLCMPHPPTQVGQSTSFFTGPGLSGTGSLVAPHPYCLFSTGIQGARVMERVRQASQGPGACGGRGVVSTPGEGRGSQVSRWCSGWESKQLPFQSWAQASATPPPEAGSWGRGGPKAHLAWPLPSREEVGPRDGARSAQ